MFWVTRMWISSEDVLDTVFGANGNRMQRPKKYPNAYHENWELHRGGSGLDPTPALRRGTNLNPTNFSWILLSHKYEGVNDISDFWPISLANCSYKIDFVLLKRLRGIIGEMVGEERLSSRCIRSRNQW